MKKSLEFLDNFCDGDIIPKLLINIIVFATNSIFRNSLDVLVPSNTNFIAAIIYLLYYTIALLHWHGWIFRVGVNNFYQLTTQLVRLEDIASSYIFKLPDKTSKFIVSIYILP